MRERPESGAGRPETLPSEGFCASAARVEYTAIRHFLTGRTTWRILDLVVDPARSVNSDSRYRALLRGIIILVPFLLARLLTHWTTEATPLRWVDLIAEATLLIYAAVAYLRLPPKMNVAPTSRYATLALFGAAILGFVVVIALARI